MTAARAVWCAVTVTGTGKEHGASHSVPLRNWPLSVTVAPLLTVRTTGERPETRYRPGGRRTVKIPERPARIRTGRCPAVVKVTTPGIGRGPDCRPPGRTGPPSKTSRPVTRPAAGRPRAPSPGAGPGPPTVPQPVSISTAPATAQASSRLIGSPFHPTVDMTKTSAPLRRFPPAPGCRASGGRASSVCAGVRFDSRCVPRLGAACDLLVEAAGGGVHLVGHGGAAGVAGVFDDDELGTGPGAGELPRGAGATAEVVATVDQDAGDAGQLAGLADQHAVLEETVVREVVRADAHEGQLRVVGPVAVCAGGSASFLRDDRILPGRPLGRGPRPDPDVGVLHHL